MNFQSEQMKMELLTHFPLETETCDDKGYFPLHYACENYQSQHVVMKLLDVFPMAASKVVQMKYSFGTHAG
jgi:hypothetical protein